jgi:hypothetical protein
MGSKIMLTKRIDFYLGIVSLSDKINVINICDNSSTVSENFNKTKVSFNINKEIYIFDAKFQYDEKLEQIKIMYVKYLDEKLSSQQFYNLLFKLAGKEMMICNYFEESYFDNFIIKIMKKFYFKKVTKKLNGTFELKFESFNIKDELISLKTKLFLKKKKIEVKIFKQFYIEVEIIKKDEHIFKRWAINRINYCLNGQEKPFLKFALKEKGDEFIKEVVSYVIIESFKKSKLYKINCLYNSEFKEQINIL